MQGELRSGVETGLGGSLAIGNEPDFDPLVQDGRDSPQHREAVAVVVGVLQAADGRLRRSPSSASVVSFGSD